MKPWRLVLAALSLVACGETRTYVRTDVSTTRGTFELLAPNGHRVRFDVAGQAALSPWSGGLVGSGFPKAGGKLSMALNGVEESTGGRWLLNLTPTIEVGSSGTRPLDGNEMCATSWSADFQDGGLQTDDGFTWARCVPVRGALEVRRATVTCASEGVCATTLDFDIEVTSLDPTPQPANANSALLEAKGKLTVVHEEVLDETTDLGIDLGMGHD